MVSHHQPLGIIPFFIPRVLYLLSPFLSQACSLQIVCPTPIPCSGVDGPDRRHRLHLQLAKIAKIDALGDGSEMDVSKPNVGRVEAVGAVGNRDPFVTRLDKCDVDALLISALASRSYCTAPQACR